MARFQDSIQQGIRADQPLATAVGEGTLYGVTDEGDIIERSDGAAWQPYSPSVPFSITTVEGLCSADTSLGTGYTDITGCSVSLTAGTWWISAVALVVDSGTAANALVKIYNFTDTVDYDASLQSITAGFGCSIPVQSLVTLAGTKTIRLAAKKSGGTMTATRYAETTILNTYIRAMKIA